MRDNQKRIVVCVKEAVTFGVRQQRICRCRWAEAPPEADSLVSRLLESRNSMKILKRYDDLLSITESVRDHLVTDQSRDDLPPEHSAGNRTPDLCSRSDDQRLKLSILTADLRLRSLKQSWGQEYATREYCCHGGRCASAHRIYRFSVAVHRGNRLFNAKPTIRFWLSRISGPPAHEESSGRCLFSAAEYLLETVRISYLPRLKSQPQRTRRDWENLFTSTTLIRRAGIVENRDTGSFGTASLSSSIRLPPSSSVKACKAGDVAAGTGKAFN